MPRAVSTRMRRAVLLCRSDPFRRHMPPHHTAWFEEHQYGIVRNAVRSPPFVASRSSALPTNATPASGSAGPVIVYGHANRPDDLCPSMMRPTVSLPCSQASA
jgi:hypothetical protein